MDLTDDDIEGSDRGGYGQYCPITRSLEVLGERWSLLIVRDLLCGYVHFNELARGNPGLSRSLLSKRLRKLEREGVVERIDGRYLLTPAGEDLRSIVFGLGDWGARWQLGDPREHELDPELLMWWVHRRLDFSHLPDRRIVLAFRFRDRPERFWVVRDVQGPSICTSDPDFEVDATIDGDLSTFYKVWVGKVALPAALRDRSVTIDGAPGVVRRMPSVLELSPIAGVVAAAASGQRGRVPSA